MDANELSRQLRTVRSERLSRRRGIVGLSLAAAACMGLISAYQVGLIRHLPEPPLPGLDADKVDASDEAYSYLSTPDGLLGLSSYALTATLAAMGGKDRAQRTPWVPLALAGKVGLDAVVAAKLTYDQWAKHRAFCSWCLVAAAATFAMLPLVSSEARSAWRTLRERFSGRATPRDLPADRYRSMAEA